MYQRQEDAGQIVDVSYTGWQDGVFYRRVIDRSVPPGPGRESWYRVDADDVDMDECDDVAETLAAVPASWWSPCDEPTE